MTSAHKIASVLVAAFVGFAIVKSSHESTHSQTSERTVTVGSCLDTAQAIIRLLGEPRHWIQKQKDVAEMDYDKGVYAILDGRGDECQGYFDLR
jgi:hypothetical protein